jgi:hypothetical protein
MQSWFNTVNVGSTTNTLEALQGALGISLGGLFGPYPRQ